MKPIIFSTPMIEKNRFEKVLEEGSKLMNITKEDFQRIMETDFMAAFVTGYYGHEIPMGYAAKRYFEEIETELFASDEEIFKREVQAISGKPTYIA